MEKHIMPEGNANDAARKIDALAVAAEFLLCAVRALASGSNSESAAVRDPIEWARLKILEFDVVPGDLFD